MTKISNSSSLKELSDLIQVAVEKGETDTSGAVRDVITDLLHFCEQNDIDFSDRLSNATTVFEEEQSLESEEEQKDRKYHVQMVRIGYGFHTIEVVAKNPNEARLKALDDAGNHSYNEKDANYEVEDIEEV